jgi:signal peptidase I
VIFKVVVGLAALVALSVVTLVLLVETGTLRVYVISASAMEPTLHCARPGLGCESGRSDHVLAFGRFVSFGRGDVVVLRPTPRAQVACRVGGTYVKRIIGLPGETVDLRRVAGFSHVYVNGERLDEPYVDGRRRDMGRPQRLSVPPGHFFVLGDNRRESCDSGDFGPVPEENVIGELVATWWPPDRLAIP